MLRYLFIIILCLIPIIGNTTETIKISELGTAASGDATDDDYFVFVNDPGGAPVTKKITGQNLFGALPRLGVTSCGTGVVYSTEDVFSCTAILSTITLNGGTASTVAVWDASQNLTALTTQNVITTGYFDGGINVRKVTDATVTVATLTPMSGYYVNADDDAIAFNLPADPTNKGYCFANLLYAQAITVNPDDADIIIMDGNDASAAAGETIVSSGAKTDAVCVIGIDATYWRVTAKTGTWAEGTPP